MQRIDNYGSLLQSYALKSMIEALGHSVGFIDIETGDTSCASRVSSDSPSIASKHNADQKLEFKLKEKLFTRRAFQRFRLKALGMQDAIDTDSSKFDMTVIGSDEVFNYSPACSWGVSFQLYGDVRSGRAISYAASCGYSRIDDVFDVHRDALIKALANLDAVSVRDENTHRFVSALGRADATVSLDPVLVYDFSQELAAAKKTWNDDILLVYGYTNRFRDSSEIEAIQDYAHSNGLRTVCVGGWQSWCDKYYCPDPFAVLDLFSHARVVVTDTFHGTIMATKFNKPLAVFLRDSNVQKLGDLLRRVHIEEASVRFPKDLKRTLDEPVDYADYNEEIASQALITKEYLCRNLGANS